jgi:hypothetical protein
VLLVVLVLTLFLAVATLSMVRSTDVSGLVAANQTVLWDLESGAQGCAMRFNRELRAAGGSLDAWLGGSVGAENTANPALNYYASPTARDPVTGHPLELLKTGLPAGATRVDTDPEGRSAVCIIERLCLPGTPTWGNIQNPDVAGRVCVMGEASTVRQIKDGEESFAVGLGKTLHITARVRTPRGETAITRTVLSISESY